MKNQKTIFISVPISLLIVYVFLYFIGVSPDSPPADEKYIEFSIGWHPSYPYYENSWNEPLSDAPMKMRWNNYVHNFFTPIHSIDRVVRNDLWLNAEEKHEITLRASQPLEGPLQIYGSGYYMDGGSISLEGVDKNLTGFKIQLWRRLGMRREGIPQYITVNDRKLKCGGPEEQQLAIDLNDWIKNSSGDTSEYTIRYVKEVIEAISNRT